MEQGTPRLTPCVAALARISYTLTGIVPSRALPLPSSRALLPPRFLCGGRRWRSRMRGALYEIRAIYRRWSERARRRTNNVRVRRPLIRLRHLLPQLKSAGGEGLSIGGTAENEPLAQLHIVSSFATNKVPAIPLSVCSSRSARINSTTPTAPPPPPPPPSFRACRRGRASSRSRRWRRLRLAR